MPVRKRLKNELLAVALILPMLGCTGDPILPSVPAPPSGTLLLDGTTTPGSTFGLFTFDPVSGELSPIATGVYANRSRLTPSGITTYSFAGQVSEDVYRLISSHKVGSEVPLLEFPRWNGTANPVGLAIDRAGGRVLFIESSHATSPGLATLRLYRVGAAGWTDILQYRGSLAGLDWHPDGRRVVTTVRSQLQGSVREIAIIEVATGNLTLLGSTTEPPTGEVVFSPDGRSIVFSRFNAEGGVELASIGFDGGRPIDLPPHLEGEMPTVSPDGQFLAYCKRVVIGINRPLARFVRRLSDGYTEQVLPPEQYPTLGCINDWVT